MSVIATGVFALSGNPMLQLTSTLSVYGASTVLLGAGWWKGRRRPGRRDPLIGLAFLALLLYTLGTVGYQGVPVVSDTVLPVPSVFDILFFTSYGLFAMLLWRLGSRSGTNDRHQYLDTLIVVLGVMPLIAVRLIEPQLAGGPVTAEQVVYLGYPVVVAVLLGLAIRLAFRAHRNSTAYLLLGGWIGFELVGDLILLEAGVAGTYAYGQPWQALWVLSAGCIGALALHPDARAMLQPRESPPLRGRSRLFVIGLALIGPMIADSMGERADVLIMIVGVILIIAVCLRLSGLLIDIAEQRRYQDELRRLSERLSHQATHDPLTGLANRALLNERLSALFEPGANAATSVLLLDVDDFKLVNDSLGHGVGDMLLVEVARRIERELRAEDRGGRLGGDEFVVILDEADAEHAQALAERLLVSLARPMLLGEVEVSVSVSVGIATSNEVRDGLNLLGAADMAMYLAKQRGKAGTAVFEPQMQETADERLMLETDLRRALRDQELFLAYQPIVDLETGALAGVEALIRWRHGTQGLVSPEVFIPIAERTGLILPLGSWVLREAVAQLQRWDLQAPQFAAMILNVNISTRQLERPGLLCVVDELIAGGLDPARLVLEITETALTIDGEAVSETLHQLRVRGVRLAVDDFGTGYSSLSRLQAAPVTQLKIDRSFVNEIQTAASLAPIIHATLAMAEGLGLAVIAEGVETQAQLQYLRRLGCAHAQGYLMARPQDADSISELLTEALPWADLLVATTDAADPAPAASRLLSHQLLKLDAESPGVAAAVRELQPSEVIQAAEAIAVAAAAEVAADAAVTAQAAVTAACAAALHAAAKAERVAAEAADIAAEAARFLAAADNRGFPQPQWDATTSLTELLAGDGRYTAQDAARDVAATRTAKAAASAVLKVAAKVESVAVAAAAASASAAGLIELRLAEEAADAAATLVASLTPHPQAGGGDVPWSDGTARPNTQQTAPKYDFSAASEGVRPVPHQQGPGASRLEIDLMIEEMKLAGASPTTIAARLNRLGERTPAGLRWHRTSVQDTHLLSLQRRATDR
jgi:diguanylate cyclase (GGDEF)-like protein